MTFLYSFLLFQIAAAQNAAYMPAWRNGNVAAAKTIDFDDPQDQGFWCAVTRVQIPPLAPLAHGSKRPTAWEVLNS